MGSWLLYRADKWWGLTQSGKDNEMERSGLRGFPFRVWGVMERRRCHWKKTLEKLLLAFKGLWWVVGHVGGQQV